MVQTRKLTPQEALVAAFARYSISGYSTFHPKLFGNGREPADMIIKIGKAVIFVNMHHGKSYFEDLCKHNLDQARDRIEEWKNGRPIRGKNKDANFHINWADIDYIHVVSVVDGPHAACLGHDVLKLHMDQKVSLATTVTSGVMRRLAELGGGARDLINLARVLEMRGKVTEVEALLIVQSRHDDLANRAKKAVSRMPNRLPPAIIRERTVSAFDEHRTYLQEVRRLNAEAGILLSDLAWQDIFAITSFTLDTISKIEWSPYGCVRYRIFEEPFPFIVIVSTSIDQLSVTVQPFIQKAKVANARFIYMLCFSRFGALPTLALFETERGTATEIDLARTSSGMSQSRETKQ